jgi:hypothetical protein
LKKQKDYQASEQSAVNAKLPFTASEKYKSAEAKVIEALNLSEIGESIFQPTNMTQRLPGQSQSSFKDNGSPRPDFATTNETSFFPVSKTTK